jgi:hypothetical protein
MLHKLSAFAVHDIPTLTPIVAKYAKAEPSHSKTMKRK